MSETTSFPNEGLRRLVEGYREFYHGHPARKGFCALQAQKVASEQHPHSLVISCFDSRVCPEIIFNTLDGEICVHRNMSNKTDRADLSVVSSLYFSVVEMNVQNVIILGHSDCKAVQCLRRVDTAPRELHDWLALGGCHYDGNTVNEAVEHNVQHQLIRLRELAFIEKAESAGKLRLEGMVYQIPTGRLERYDAQTNTWTLIPTEQ